MTDLDLNVLLKIEHDGWRSLCEGSGGSYYGELMTDDGLMVLVNGAVLGRAEVVASLDDAPAWDSYQIRDARLLNLGPQAAALVYRARAERQGQAPFEASMTSLYRSTDGCPRLVLYQQTTSTHH